MNFKELSIKEPILRVIEENGYTIPTEIQSQIIPHIINGEDVLGQSQTGTGKTLAFAASILNSIQENRKTQALILAPTRELAIQILRETMQLGKYMNFHSVCVYGSSSIQDQIKELKNGCEIVLGTPGRVMDLLKRRALNLEDLSFFVLDESDEMLSMGFHEELEYIFSRTKTRKQVLLFSATMPRQILAIAKKYMKSDYKVVSVISDVKTAEHIDQFYYEVSDKTRFEAMCRIMDYYQPRHAIIFCRTKRSVDEVYEKLSGRGYSIEAIHGDITQGQRIATLDRFKDGAFQYLIATDVAARGIHVDQIDLVINYNLPESNEAYVHRIGRTGRANQSGCSVCLVNQREEKIIGSIEHHIKTKIAKKALPTKDEILENRIENLDGLLNELKVKEATTLFDSYIDKLSNEEMHNVISQFLDRELYRELGSNFDIDVSIKKDKKRSRSRENDDSIRVFVTIGKIDQFEKRDFLSWIEKKAQVPEGTCTGIEVLPKFTFMNIKKDKIDKVINACYNEKYNNRIIRIEKAKK